MKSLTMFIIRLCYKVVSALFPQKAGQQAFRLFQRTRKLPFKKTELDFYRNARIFEVVHPVENIRAYELGDPAGKLVLLVHGWDSNAGSMGAIAFAMAEEGYRVVTLDLPAHGYSQRTHTNLRDCREALRALIYHLRPAKPFSIITHSFGSAVATMALTETRFTVDNFIMLTSPNRLIDVFDEFKNQIALGDRAYSEMLQHACQLLNQPVQEVTVDKKMQQVNFKKLVIIHDVHDKVLPYQNAVRINEALPSSKLYTLKNTGHYRMLWNGEVIKKVMNEFNPKAASGSYLDEYVEQLISA
jgi:pimeloyl-ACP methyl ester carboxylesterase